MANKIYFTQKIESLYKRIQAGFSRYPVLLKGIRLLLTISAFFIILFLSVYLWMYTTVPTSATFQGLRNFTSSEVYSKDGRLLGKYFLYDRTNIKLEAVSGHIVNALIATEDIRFYKHKGIDKRSLLRVFFKTILQGREESGGGSTITQQLAKNLFPRKRFRIFSLPLNKIREFIIAEKLENFFTKEEILTLYLNTVPFGENAYGIEVAAKRFFNKSAAEVTVQEAATLVGMLKATSSFNPRKHPEAALNRRNVVLAQMNKYDFLPGDQYDSIRKLPLVVDYKFIDHNQGPATYFREQLRKELVDWCARNRKEDGTPYNIYTDGLKIYTSLDYTMQIYAEAAVRKHMGHLQKQFIDHWGKQNPWGRNAAVLEDAKKRSERYRKLKKEGLSEKEIAADFQNTTDISLFSYKGNRQVQMTPLDSIRYYLKFLHAGFLVMDPSTAEIRAWVGGINHEYFKYDHVNRNAKRQVGSTFKPIVYAEALRQGFQPCDFFPNEKKIYEEYDNWSPANADGQYGGEYSLQGALINSVNTVSADLIMKTGVEGVVTLAESMGITSPLKPVPSLALGTADASLYEMVGAYAVFAANGVYRSPRYLLRIENSEGKVLQDFSVDYEEGMSVLTEEQAWIMTRIMENVINQGTGQRLRYQYKLNVPIAGKTGTTQNHADGWFIGYTPDLVAGAWVGGEDRRVRFRSISLGQGANMALPIWGEFMASLLADPQYAAMRRAKFPEVSRELQDALDCPPYLEPIDSTSFWDKLFGKNSSKDSNFVRNRASKRPSSYSAPKKSPKPKKKNDKGFWDIFKRR